MTLYRVRWQGYSAADDSWLSFEDMNGPCSRAALDFIRSQEGADEEADNAPAISPDEVFEEFNAPAAEPTDDLPPEALDEWGGPDRPPASDLRLREQAAADAEVDPQAAPPLADPLTDPSPNLSAREARLAERQARMGAAPDASNSRALRELQ